MTARESFLRLLLAEWTKLRSVSRWVITLLAATVLTAGLSVLAASGNRTDVNEHTDLRLRTRRRTGQRQLLLRAPADHRGPDPDRTDRVPHPAPGAQPSESRRRADDPGAQPRPVRRGGRRNHDQGRYAAGVVLCRRYADRRPRRTYAVRFHRRPQGKHEPQHPMVAARACRRHHHRIRVGRRRHLAADRDRDAGEPARDRRGRLLRLVRAVDLHVARRRHLVRRRAPDPRIGDVRQRCPHPGVAVHG